MDDFKWDYIYCYPHSDVLINKKDIKNISVLSRYERDSTAVRIAEIETLPIKGLLNLKHLQAIHKYIFFDIYDWAGKLRTVNISKANMFYRFDYIKEAADKLFNELEAEGYLIEAPESEIPKRLAYYLSEINVIHPFREGNGRTQRVFIEYLAKAAGYDVDYSTVTRDEMIHASIAAFACDYTYMERIFSGINSKISIKEQEDFIASLSDSKTNKIMKIFLRKNFNFKTISEAELDLLRKSDIPFDSKAVQDKVIIRFLKEYKYRVNNILNSNKSKLKR